jgi:methyl-coenzyme M reductase gamma subunit
MSTTLGAVKDLSPSVPMRGCTVHGHSLRLEENGMQFDMLARTEMGTDRNVYAVKDQVGIPLDKKIKRSTWKSHERGRGQEEKNYIQGRWCILCGEVGARKHDETVEALYHM